MDKAKVQTASLEQFTTMTKSMGLNNVIRFLMGLVFISWLFYVLQIVQIFIPVMGEFTFTDLVMIMGVPIWQMVAAVIMLLSSLVFWKKTILPGWVAMAAIMTLLVPYADFVTGTGEVGYVGQVIVLFYSLHTYGKLVAEYKKEFGGITVLHRIISVLALVVFLGGMLMVSAGLTYLNIYEDLLMVSSTN